jgi:hypothetical protein
MATEEVNLEVDVTRSKTLAVDGLIGEVIGKAYLVALAVDFPGYERRGGSTSEGDVVVTVLVTDPNEVQEGLSTEQASSEFSARGRTLGEACTECLTNFRARFGGGS